MSTQDRDLSQEKLRDAIETKCRNGEELSAREIAAVRKHPDILTGTLGRFSVLAAAAYSKCGTVLKQLSAEGLITPEMLVTGSGIWTDTGGAANPVRQFSNLELMELRYKTIHLDPAVYRKAVAMSLRKEESALPPGAARSEHRRAQLARLYTMASTGRTLTPAQVSAVKADPYLLTDVAGHGMSALSAAAHFAGTLGSSATLTSMLATGVLTPELLITPAYKSNFESPTTHLEFIQQRKVEGLLDPAVYRRAVAMRLRKEESLDDRRPWTADRRNTLWQVRWNSDAYGWGESGLAEIEADPGLVMGPAPAYGLLYHALVMAGQGKPALLKQLNPYITPEMLVAEVKDNFYYDMLSRAMADGTDRYLDPKVVRQATATKHQKEESLSRRVISQLV